MYEAHTPVNEMVGLKSIYDELMVASAAHQAVRICYDSFAEKEEIQTKLCTCKPKAEI